MNHNPIADALGTIEHAAERFTHDISSHLHPTGYHATSSATSAPKETTMSLAADLRAFATKIEGIEDDVVTKAQSAAKNPETKAVLSDLAGLAELAIPEGTITGIASGLKTLLGLYSDTETATDPAPVPPQPAPATA